MKIAVIYKSKYGTTKQYASWIAEEMNVELFEISHIKPKKLQLYDIIIYGGGLYAGGISGINLIKKYSYKKLVIFTVGLADPTVTDYSKVLNKNLSSEQQNNAKIFHLHGGINYKKLGIIHRVMMLIMKKMILKQKSRNELSDEDKKFLATYGCQIDCSKKESIRPIIDYVKSIS